MEDLRTSRVWMAMAVILLLPALYVGSYLALLDPYGVTQALPAHYRFGGDCARWTFYPINLLDRQLRPSYWNALRTSIYIDYIETGSSPELEVWMMDHRPANDGVRDSLRTSVELGGDVGDGEPLGQ
jgi:hypothetical protein